MYGRTPPPLTVVRSAPSAEDDASLAAALIARERDAPAQAWTRLSPLVLRLLRRYFGPGPDRQDLCQEVFLRFFTRIDELRDRNALRSFLIGICLGVAQNELRRAKVRRWIFLTQSGELPDAPISGANPEAREAAARVYKILAGVNAEDRTLFVTRYIEKMELAEIAAVIGRPLSTTKRRLARATRRIAARMGSDAALADYAEGLVTTRAGGVGDGDDGDDGDDVDRTGKS
jgi:RNA polymerase sigma-70 factor (ECF subfamily)